MGEINLPQEYYDRVGPNLYPGALWRVVSDGLYDTGYSNIYPYLGDKWQGGSPVPPIARQGETVVYMGGVRLEETKYSGATVRPLRHCFLIGGKQYLVLDITQLDPVS